MLKSRSSALGLIILSVSSGASSPSPYLWAVQVLAEQGRARASRMTLPHNVCYTPMFMPVGTQGKHCIAIYVRPPSGELFSLTNNYSIVIVVTVL